MSNAERILQRLEWQVVRPLDGLLQGDYRSFFLGAGLDLAGIREYQPGDDTRYMDWNVTARLSVPYVRQYMEDREINVWFLLDLSPSMEFGTGDKTKRDLMIDFVGVIARLVTRRGNRVGALVYGGQMGSMIPCRSGRLHVLRLLNDLLKVPMSPSHVVTDLSVLLDAARAVVRRRSLLFLVSDFVSVPGWDRPLRLLRKRHDVVGVRVWDPAEEELPDIGGVYFDDAETGDQLYVDTSDRRFRSRFERLTADRRTALKDAFTKAQADFLPISTQDELVPAIVRFSKLRKERRRWMRASVLVG